MDKRPLTEEQLKLFHEWIPYATKLALRFAYSKRFPTDQDYYVNTALMARGQVVKKYDPAKGTFKTCRIPRLFGALIDEMRAWSFQSRIQIAYREKKNVDIISLDTDEEASMLLYRYSKYEDPILDLIYDDSIEE